MGCNFKFREGGVLMNWKKTRDDRNNELTVSMTMEKFKKDIEPKLKLSDKIDSLNSSAKEIVLQLLEELLKEV